MQKAEMRRVGEGSASVLSIFFFSSRRRHTRWTGDWSSDVCSSDLLDGEVPVVGAKNSALKLMAAALLAPGRTVVTNVPRIKIGRASCRESVERSVDAAAFKVEEQERRVGRAVQRQLKRH